MNFNFDVFERQKDRVGGRVASITMDVKDEIVTELSKKKKKNGENVDDEKAVAKFEAGASLAVKGNRYVWNFAEKVRFDVSAYFSVLLCYCETTIID